MLLKEHALARLYLHDFAQAGRLLGVLKQLEYQDAHFWQEVHQFRNQLPNGAEWVAE